MDGDLISRSTVIKRLEMISKNCKANKAVSKYIGKQIFDISEKTVDVCIREAKNVLAVDAVPVVHGRWLKNPSGFTNAICSCCAGDSPTDSRFKPIKTNFCPNCGAKMDGGE